MIVASEAAMSSQTRYGIEVLAAAIALALAHRERDRLTTTTVVTLAAALPAAIALAHLARGFGGDIDVESVYLSQGRDLLHGTYPHSEYPPGAVSLFAFEAWLATPRVVNPFVMALCQAAAVWAICSIRTKPACWLAACVALWPTNAFFWEFKFDALPAALLAVGLALAWRDRWAAAGATLGVGAAVKWTPGLALVILVLWLLVQSRPREAARLATGFAVAAAAVVVPYLVWSPTAVWASVTRQAPRGITPESFWYPPLHLFGLASQPGAIYAKASVSDWANTLAVCVQVTALIGLVALVVLRRPPLSGAIAIAATAPALFLLLNKVFSAQFVLVLLVAGCLGAALVGRHVAIAILLLSAATSNVLVYPIGRASGPASAVLFTTSLAAFGVVLAHAGNASQPPQSR